jgi:hypothetical protein
MSKSSSQPYDRLIGCQFPWHKLIDTIDLMLGDTLEEVSQGSFQI